VRASVSRRASCGCVHLYIYYMTEFEWDERKALSNLRKHGVDFADAVSALEDELAMTIPYGKR
jgi:hypothetical protein